MTDNFDQGLEVDVLAASLSLERQESGDILLLLARKLQLSLPKNTQIQRQWFGLGAIKSITLCFDDYHYEISRQRYGEITAKVIKIVGGVKIKTTEITTTEWSQAVAQTLAEKANNNTQMREALSKFTLG
ncbi:hypothetical protein [Anabaena azotica]|uniref:hypothetical protein n=1 Tax=Anabaena azotica TaxID=197653 RepID=UPI0039A68D70